MATGAPGTNGVWQYGEDDSEATFSALLNKVASTTDTQIGTDRGRLTTLEARKISGLVPVAPTSVTVASGTGTANSLGVVTFTGASSVTLNGIFTAEYENYKIILNILNSTGGNNNSIYMRIGGSTTSYAYQYLRAYNANVNASYSGSAPYWWVGPGATVTSCNNLEATIYSPFINATTKILSTSGGYTGTETQLFTMFGEHPAASRTSLTILPAANGITGTIEVLGFND